MRDETIFFLLVEDNPDDELFTRRTLKKSNICNQLVVAHDGAEALDYLFCTGTHEGRDSGTMPQVIPPPTTAAPVRSTLRASQSPCLGGYPGR
jgi:two-component system, response regulator